MNRKEVARMTNLERMRRDAGMTMMELSEKSGVSYPVIAKIEAGGIGSVTVKTLLRLADALSCDPRMLF